MTVDQGEMVKELDLLELQGEEEVEM